MEGIDLCRVVNSSHCFPQHFHDDLYIVGLIASGTCNCLEVEKKEAVAGPAVSPCSIPVRSIPGFR